MMKSLNLALVFSCLALCACTTQPAQEGDRELVLKISQLEPYGLGLPDNFAVYERITREEWFDGSVMIEYEFEAPDELGLPYLYSVAERHPSHSDACLSFHAGNVGARIGGAKLLERNDLYRFGDKSRFGLLVDNDDPFGNMFSMCRGKTAFMTILGGFYFDEGEVWAELITPTLEALQASN